MDLSRKTIFRNREDWLLARRWGIGGSDAPSIMGNTSYSSPYITWARKLGYLDEAPEEMHMRLGRLMERDAHDIYQEETGNELIDTGDFTIFWGERDYQFATIDRVDNTDKIVVEFKAIGGMNKKEWRDGAPLKYLIQVQHQLNVLGAERGRLAAIFGGHVFDFAIIDVDRNDRFIDILNQEEERFWDMVLTETPPPVSHLAIETWALNHSKSDPYCEQNVDFKAFQPYDKEFLVAREQLRVATERFDSVANKIRALMGQAETLLVNNQVAYTFREDVSGCRRLTRKIKGDLRP